MKGPKLYISFYDYAYIKFTNIKSNKIVAMLDIGRNVVWKVKSGEGRVDYQKRYGKMSKAELKQLVLNYVPEKVIRVRNLENRDRICERNYSFKHNVFTVTFDKMASVYNPAITRND